MSLGRLRHFAAAIVPVLLIGTVPLVAADAKRNQGYPEGDWVELLTLEGSHMRPSCSYVERSGYGFYVNPGTNYGFWGYAGGELSPLYNIATRWDNSKEPKWMDFYYEKGSQDCVPGIYRLSGELLVWVTSKDGQRPDSKGYYPTRPKDFSASKTNRQIIRVLRPCGEHELRLNPNAPQKVYKPNNSRWRVLCQIENDEAHCPIDSQARLQAEDRTGGPEAPVETLCGWCYGGEREPVFCQSPCWLEEVRRSPKDEYTVRPGICKREGDCLIWVVAGKQRPYDPSITEAADRPTSFKATKENHQILRVLYPAPDPTDKKTVTRKRP